MAPTWRFAQFELDPANQVLKKNGLPVKLPPQPFKVLVLLVSRLGGLVRRDELCRALWGDDVVVDFEHGLNTCLRQIRAVLGDDADAPRFIETVPRVGYRFKATVDAPAAIRRRPAWPVAAVVAAAVLSVATGTAIWAGRYRAPQRASGPQLEARGQYARGMVTLERETDTATAAARQILVDAARRDPSSPEIPAGIALTYVTHPVGLAGVAPTGARAKATEMVARARAAAGNRPSSEVEHAAAELNFASGDWPAAEKAFLRSIDLAPADAAVHEGYAVALTLRGRLDDALREARLAQRLDPLSARMASAVASTLRFSRRYDEAAAAAQAALRLDPTYGPAFHTLGLCFEANGQYDQAIAAYEREGRPSGNLGHAYAKAGRIEDARHVIKQFEAQYAATGTGEGAVAQVYIGLGDYERAFVWLEKDAASGNQSTTLKVAEVWDPLRSDPRFAVLLARLGLDK